MGPHRRQETSLRPPCRRPHGTGRGAVLSQPQGRFLSASECSPGCGLAPGLQGVQGDPPGWLGLGILTAGLQGLLLGGPCRGNPGTGSGCRGVLGRRGGWRLFHLRGGGRGTAGVLDSAGGGPLPWPGSWRRPRGGLTLGFLCCIRSSHAQNRLLFQGDSKLIFLECHEGAVTICGRDGQEGPVAGPSFPKQKQKGGSLPNAVGHSGRAHHQAGKRKFKHRPQLCLKARVVRGRGPG